MCLCLRCCVEVVLTLQHSFLQQSFRYEPFLCKIKQICSLRVKFWDFILLYQWNNAKLNKTVLDKNFFLNLKISLKRTTLLNMSMELYITAEKPPNSIFIPNEFQKNCCRVGTLLVSEDLKGNIDRFPINF